MGLQSEEICANIVVHNASIAETVYAKSLIVALKIGAALCGSFGWSDSYA